MGIFGWMVICRSPTRTTPTFDPAATSQRCAPGDRLTIASSAEAKVSASSDLRSTARAGSFSRRIRCRGIARLLGSSR